jgi:predicted dehydrogenase
VRWGILGPGRISVAFLTGLAGSAEQAAVAVGSRSAQRAKPVAQRFGLPRWYGSYAELVADPELDAVYIGLPNSLHAEWTVAAARAGKHVLCEKPLGRSRTEAESLFRAAEEHGVRLMEAFMYRFHPRTLALGELLADGAIGEVRLIRASFGFTVQDDSDVRLSPELAGGALMDVGCYCVNLARLAVGSPPARVSAVARWAPAGVDETLAGTLDYSTGAVAQIACSLASSHHHRADIVGTDGVIELPAAFTPLRDRPAELVLRRGARGGENEVLRFDPVDQYRLEAEGFARLVAAGPGNHGLPEMRPDESLDNAATIDALLRSARLGQPSRP